MKKLPRDKIEDFSLIHEKDHGTFSFNIEVLTDIQKLSNGFSNVPPFYSSLVGANYERYDRVKAE